MQSQPAILSGQHATPHPALPKQACRCVSCAWWAALAYATLRCQCWIVCAATFAGGSLWCSVARRIAPRLYVPIFQFGPLTSSTPRPWASRYSQVGSPSSPSPSPLTPFEAARGERPGPDILSLGMLLPITRALHSSPLHINPVNGPLLSLATRLGRRAVV